MNDKLDMKSKALAGENIERIREMFPGCVVESDEGLAIDFGLLKQELSGEIIEGVKERYRLEWAGKREAMVNANIPTTKTLRPVVEDSVEFENTENLYIEGDNLEVLKILRESYLGKVKMIYIDPPYNTGKDFVYRDTFSKGKLEHEIESGDRDEMGQRLVVNPETDGRYHSNWLSMMYPRLKLARTLLSEDGVIFISIDDNEVHNLRKLCDEVFGEYNFFTEIIVQSNKRGQTYKQISKTHEYVLVYTKTDNCELNEIEKKGEKEDLNLTDDIGDYNIRELRNRNPKFGKHNRPKLFYPFFVNSDIIDKDGFSPISLQQSEEYSIIVEPFNSKGKASCWRWGTNLSEKNCYENTYSSNLVAKRKKNGNYNIYEKYRKSTYKAKSIWIDKEVITEKGTIELGKLNMGNLFDFPKPLGLLRKIMNLGLKHNEIVLDFFSGSATAAHAVMELNAEDGGSRKFIMVQLAEETDEKSEAFKAGFKNICEIGKERIRRAGSNITKDWEKKKRESELLDKIEGNEEARKLDTGFRVFRLDSSNMKDVYYKPQDYKQVQIEHFADNVKAGRSGLDLLVQVMLDWGLGLGSKIEAEKIAGKQVYRVGESELMACFDYGIDEEFAKVVAKEKVRKIVFRDSSFASDTAKENVKQLLKQLSVETEMKVI
jgi:adenine-specific DNA-methyltransferase